MLVITHILNILMYVLLLRAKQVNLESLEEMGCLAKKEYMDYQENWYVCVCVSMCQCSCSQLYM